MFNTFLQSLNLQQKGGEIRSKAKFISLISVAVDEVHCVLSTEWGSSNNNKIVQLFLSFTCVVFSWLSQL